MSGSLWWTAEEQQEGWQTTTFCIFSKTKHKTTKKGLENDRKETQKRPRKHKMMKTETQNDHKFTQIIDKESKSVTDDAGVLFGSGEPVICLSRITKVITIHPKIPFIYSGFYVVVSNFKVLCLLSLLLYILLLKMLLFYSIYLLLFYYHFI